MNASTVSPALVRPFVAVLAALLLLASSLSRPPAPASAGASWCWDDPILAIDGKIMHINIGVQGSPDTVRAAIQNAHTVLYLPYGVPASVIGFTNLYFTETVEIRRAAHLKWVQPSLGGELVSKVDFEAYITFRATAVLPAQAQVVYLGKELTKNGDTTTATIKINGTIQ